MSKTLPITKAPRNQSAKAMIEAAQKVARAEAEAIQRACNDEIRPILERFNCVLIGVPQFGQIQGSNAFAVGAEVAIRYVPPAEEPAKG